MHSLVWVVLLATAGGLLLWGGARLERKHNQAQEPEPLTTHSQMSSGGSTLPHNLTEDDLRAMGWYPLNNGSGLWATDL